MRLLTFNNRQCAIVCVAPKCIENIPEVQFSQRSFISNATKSQLCNVHLELVATGKKNAQGLSGIGFYSVQDPDIGARGSSQFFNQIP